MNENLIFEIKYLKMKKISVNSPEYRDLVTKLLGKEVQFDNLPVMHVKIPTKEDKHIPETECIAVAELRKIYGKEIDLNKWMKMEKNLYTGRQGRIFINKEIFHYPGSKWANPYKVSESEYTLEDSLKLYEEHVRSRLDLIESLKELEGKTLGCFCKQTEPCHAKVLVKLFKEFVN